MIELKNVSFHYEKQTVFHNVSFCVKRGEKVGIVGESGCGKSTLLHLIAGLYPPDAGNITIDGENDPEAIVKKVSVVMQSPMLLPMTIRENITMGHEYPQEHIAQVIEAAGLKKWIDTLPEGMDTYLGDRSDELSGGQAQRIAIARALCKDAPVLLLDEPTSALDAENTAIVMEALGQYAKDKTVIHVTHSPKLLSGYDRIVSISEITEGGR